MSTPPQIRLHLFHAREAARTVILRQGPTRLWRMILWNRDADSFHDGQWLKQKVYVDQCDLSPDGRHFLYFTLDGQWSSATEGTYSVICKPPFFTALRLFPQGGPWGSGGFFVDATRFCINGFGKPVALRDSGDGLEQVFLATATPGNPSGLVDRNDKPLRLAPATRDWLANGRPSRTQDYSTEGPCLYRQVPGGRQLIRDFSDMAFEPIQAPYGPSAVARKTTDRRVR